MTIQILENILDRLGFLYKQGNLTPGTLVRLGLKPGWNVVVGTGGQCGMAMSFTGSIESFGKPEIDIDRLKSYIGKNLFIVARDYLRSPSWQERAIGVASLSALSQPWLEPAQLKKRGFEVERAGHFNSMVKPDDIVAVVGYGGGIAQLVGKCKELHVTDMRPRSSFQSILISDTIEYTPREVQVHPEKENREVISRADVVFITGSSLVNGTFRELLDYASGARTVIVYGASAGLIPDVLLENRVNYLHSYRVSDPVAFEDGVTKEMNMESVIRNSQQSQSIRRST